MHRDDTLIGLDVKTKDLDGKAYSDGGVCSVDNLIQFLVRDRAILLLAEIAHQSDGNRGRRVAEVRVVPLHLLPASDIRIENLGTGQVRLNRPLHTLWPQIDWNQTVPDFLNIFTDLAIAHFMHVGEVAGQRVEAMRAFRAGGYRRLVLP